MFSQQRIKTILNDYVTVRLYAGRMPPGLKQIPDGDEAQLFRDEKLKNNGLPFYVVLKPITDRKLVKIGFFDKGVIDPFSEEFPSFLTDAVAAAAEIKPK